MSLPGTECLAWLYKLHNIYREVFAFFLLRKAKKKKIIIIIIIIIITGEN